MKASTDQNDLLEDAPDYATLVGDKNVMRLVAMLEKAAMDVNRSDFGKICQFVSLGQSEDKAQQVTDALFSNDMLEALRALTGARKDIYGYLVTLDCFSECYKTFGRVGDWPVENWKEAWENGWMKRGLRRVNDGNLAKKFLQSDYVRNLAAGSRLVRILDWQKSPQVSQQAKELRLEWSAFLPAFHRGRIVGFLNLSFPTKEAAVASIGVLWWLTQSVLCPFLVDAFTALDDRRMEEMVWRLFKLELERSPGRRFVYDEHLGRWLLDRIYMFCPHHRDSLADESEPLTPADYVVTVMDNFWKQCPTDTPRKWFEVEQVPQGAIIRMPKRPLEGVLWELLTNAYVAVARRNQLHPKGHSRNRGQGPQGSARITIKMDFRTVGGVPRVVRLAVHDLGVGMDEYTLQRAFDLGFSGTPSSYEANGLGLKIVRLNVEKYDGTVSVKSKAGKGTVVALEFPL